MCTVQAIENNPGVAQTHAEVVFLHSKMHMETNADLIIKTT